MKEYENQSARSIPTWKDKCTHLISSKEKKLDQYEVCGETYNGEFTASAS